MNKKVSFKKLRDALTAVLAASSLLTGCASTNGAIETRATLQSAKNLELATEANNHAISPGLWPTSNWWERYGDLQLRKLVEEALAGNPSLRIAEARIRKAVALSGLAEANKYPQIAGNDRNIRQRFSEHSTVPRPIAGSWDYVNEMTLNFTYELDIWGKNQAAFEASLDRVHASEVDSQAARLAIASSVVQGYFEFAQNFEQLDLAELVLARKEKILDLVKQRLSAGIDSETELKQAESDVLAASQSLASCRERLAITRNQLGALLGKAPSRADSISRPRLKLEQAGSLPSNIPAELIGRRPDVVSQRWLVEAAGKDIAVARAQFYPNINLLAFTGFQSLGLDEFLKAGSRVAGIGPAVSLPIFDGGRLRANWGAHNAEYDVTVEQYNQTLINAIHDVINQATSIRWVTEQHQQQVLSVAAAQRTYELAMQRYRAGVDDYLQALNAELQLYSQQKRLIELNTRSLQLDAQLVRALGGGLKS